MEKRVPNIIIQFWASGELQFSHQTLSTNVRD